MKVIYVVPDLVVGGVTSVVTRNIIQLKKMNCEILLVSLKNIDNKSFEECTIYSLNVSRSLDFILKMRKFNKIVTMFNPDIIHSHTYYPHMFVALYGFLFRSSIKRIFNEHGTLSNTNFDWNFFKLFIRISDIFVNVSKVSLDSYLNKGLFKKNNSYVLYNGINTNEFSNNNVEVIEREQYGIGNEFFIFGYVGRLSPEKDVHNLIKAIEVLYSNTDKKFKLLIIGDGSEINFLKKTVIDNKLEDIIIFFGKKSNIVPFYSIIDTLVLSSKTEGLPTVLLEAMSMSCPVISTNCGGVEEIFEGINPFIVRIEDSLDLSMEMKKILDMDISERKLIGEMNRQQIISKFSIEKTSRDILSLYAKILK